VVGFGQDSSTSTTENVGADARSTWRPDVPGLPSSSALHTVKGAAATRTDLRSELPVRDRPDDGLARNVRPDRHRDPLKNLAPAVFAAWNEFRVVPMFREIGLFHCSAGPGLRRCCNARSPIRPERRTRCDAGIARCPGDRQEGRRGLAGRSELDQHSLSAGTYADVTESAGSTDSGDQQLTAESPADGIESLQQQSQLDGEGVAQPIVEFCLDRWQGSLRDQQHLREHILVHYAAGWRWMSVVRRHAGHHAVRGVQDGPGATRVGPRSANRAGRSPIPRFRPDRALMSSSAAPGGPPGLGPRAGANPVRIMMRSGRWSRWWKPTRSAAMYVDDRAGA